MAFQTGANFGPAGPSQFPVLAPFASYGSFTANCSVQQIGLLVCATAAGAGADLVWTVTVGGQTSAPADNVTRYALPEVSSIEPVGHFATAGGESVTIYGVNFGPPELALSFAVFMQRAASPQAPDGYLLSLPNCVRTAHQAISCITVEASGIWFVAVTIVGQNSSQLQATSVPLTYTRPVLASEPLGTAGPLSAAPGGSPFTVAGTQFGPSAPFNSVSLTMTPAAFPELRFQCACVVSVPHVELTCTPPPGVGTALVFVAEVDGLLSNAYNSSVGFELPSITDFSPTLLPSVGGTLSIVGTGTLPQRAARHVVPANKRLFAGRIRPDQSLGNLRAELRPELKRGAGLDQQQLQRCQLHCYGVLRRCGRRHELLPRRLRGPAGYGRRGEHSVVHGAVRLRHRADERLHGGRSQFHCDGRQLRPVQRIWFLEHAEPQRRHHVGPSGAGLHGAERHDHGVPVDRGHWRALRRQCGHWRPAR